MLSVKQLFIADGLDVPGDQIKLVRHVDHQGRSIGQIIKEGLFDLYQAEQKGTVRPFHGCQVILSFIGIESNKAQFYGAYRVNGSRPFKISDWPNMPEWMLKAHKDAIPRIYYDLEEIELFRSYRDRLIVQWRGPLSWHQRKDLDIYEILPATIATLFPGYQEVFLNYEQLRAIFADSRAHRDWKAALKANAGIYRIVDMSTGETYIGSAYGSDGLWGRWGTYAKTGHGGNKLLKGRKPENFCWSIVRTLSTTMAPRDVIQIESMEKKKHGSRAIGLNGN